MKILHAHEVNINSSLNRIIRSGQLGVITNENGDYELVYFTHCHYMSASGRLSNTFDYNSFNDDGTLNTKRKSYLYRNIYELSDDSKDHYKTDIYLIES